MMELNGEEVSADELVSRRDSIEQELKRQFAILEEVRLWVIFIK